jgi:hypothetical protein
MEDKLAIIETVQNWALWRDAGDWERFGTVWHDDGWMTATWFPGPGAKFIEVSRAGFERGVSILHFLGGSACDLKAPRAIAQTKMTINQRAQSTACWSTSSAPAVLRFLREARAAAGRSCAGSRSTRRIGSIRSIRGEPQARAELLAGFPEGYRHLAYLQTKNGFTIKLDLPQLKGPWSWRSTRTAARGYDGAPSAFPDDDQP